MDGRDQVLALTEQEADRVRFDVRLPGVPSWLVPLSCTVAVGLVAVNAAGLAGIVWVLLGPSEMSLLWLLPFGVVPGALDLAASAASSTLARLPLGQPFRVVRVGARRIDIGEERVPLERVARAVLDSEILTLELRRPHAVHRIPDPDGRVHRAILQARGPGSDVLEEDPVERGRLDTLRAAGSGEGGETGM